MHQLKFLSVRSGNVKRSCKQHLLKPQIIKPKSRNLHKKVVLGMGNIKRRLKAFMKQMVYILLLGIYSCTERPNKTIESESQNTFEADEHSSTMIDTLQNIPEEMIEKEYNKSAFAYSHHALLKNEFPFDTWLTEIVNKDSLETINADFDSVFMSDLPKKEITPHNLTDEWELKYLFKRGWFESGSDRTNVNKCYLSKTNKFKLQGADLMKIFKSTERWTANLIGQNKLIIRYAYWYPNGNQTSWEYEIIYLFTK